MSNYFLGLPRNLWQQQRGRLPRSNIIDMQPCAKTKMAAQKNNAIVFISWKYKHYFELI